MGAIFSLKIKMFSTKSIILTIFCISATHANFIAEIRTQTANCADCGMTFLGELSIKVCGKGPAPAVCCVASNLDNTEDNFNEGMEDIFTGVDLRECYNFDLGQIASADDFCKNFLGFLIFFRDFNFFFSYYNLSCF